MRALLKRSDGKRLCTARCPPSAVRRSLRASALFEHRDSRQFLALEELEERATARLDVGDVLPDTVLLDRRKRIAAACNGECRAARDGLRQRARAFAELVEFEHAHRSI